MCECILSSCPLILMKLYLLNFSRFRNRNRGSFRGGRGRGRGAGGRGAGGRGAGGRGWKKGGVEKSAEELDKELENYHAEAMQS